MRTVIRRASLRLQTSVMSTNMQERLNEEIRRRERVIRIFPNDASAIRLVGALLEEINENWSGRQYVDMTEYVEWREERRDAVGQARARAA